MNPLFYHRLSSLTNGLGKGFKKKPLHSKLGEGGAWG